MIRVLIADDHGVLRDGLTALIDDEPDMCVVATAADAVEAVSRCEQARPTIAVIDLGMPRGGGVRALKEIRDKCPDTRSLVLSMHDDALHVRASLEAGAAGYLAKHVASSEVVQAIRNVHGGQSYVRVRLADDTLSRVVDDATHQSDDTPPPCTLSPREHEVLQLIAYGHTSKEIAKMLHVSPKSVDSYRERIYQKLSLRGRADIVKYALEHHILKPEPPTQD